MAIEKRTTQHASESNISGTVLVIDDEPHLVGMYAAMLEDIHVVRTATSGEAALEQFTDEIDVVLLDRRMPGLSGDDVLDILREEEYDCRVAMITSVDPNADIVDLPFDAYVVKPVRQQDLRELVEDLLLRSEYSSRIQELLSIVSKLAALESRFSEEKLASHSEYQTLRERKERLDAANQDQLEELLDSGDTGLVYRDILGTIRDS
jgi:DNA-binding response OmpR family regulator